MKQRYILVLLVALFASASMNVWGVGVDRYYKCGINSPVNVKDQTIGTNYEYKVTFSQKGKNLGDGGTTLYSTDVQLILKPKSHQLEGTYSLSDGTLGDGNTYSSSTYVKYNSTYRYLKTGSNSTFKISKLSEGRYQIDSCEFVVYNGEDTYTYKYAYDKDNLTNDATPTPFRFDWVVTTGNKYTMSDIDNWTVKANSAINGYTITFDVNGKNDDTFYYSVVLNLQNTDNWLGTFELGESSNGIAPSSTITWKTTTRYPVSASSLTISKTSITSYKISGIWYGRQNPTGTNDPYVYNFGTGVAFTYSADPYAAEPTDISTRNFTSTEGTKLSLISTEGETPIKIKIMDENGSSVFLQFNESSFNIPAGTHSVATTGTTGTIKASGGLTSSVSNCVYFYSGLGDSYDYYITGGSLTVSYSDNNSKMTLQGDLTTAHGSTIHVDVTDGNPFYVEAEDIPVTVTAISASVYSYPNNEIILDITGTSVNGMLDFYVNDVKDLDFTLRATSPFNASSYMGDNFILSNSPENSITITHVSDNHFTLDATIVCPGQKKYIITNAAFNMNVNTYWNNEPAQTADFTLTASQLVEQTFADNLLSLDFVTADKDYISLAFNVTSDELTADTYTINDTKTIGTCLASAGYREYANQPSYVLTDDPEKVYYLRSGSLIVTNTNGNLGIHGTAVSYRGTNITLDIDIVRQVTLNVTDVAAKIEDNQVQLTITADGEGTAAGAFLRIKSDILNGTYSTTDIDLDYSFIGVAPNTTNINGNKTNSITIESNSGTCTLNATLYGEEGCTYTITNATFSFVYLLDTEDNSSELASAMDKTCDIQLGRTLYRDGYWNTLCLPFALSSLYGTPLQGAEVYRFTNAIVSAEQLDFYYEEVTAIEAGKPYIIRWTTPVSNLVKPVFEDVVIAASEGQTVVGTDASFIGILKPTHLVGINLYFVGDDNYVYQPALDDETSTPSFRAYLQLNPGIPAPRRMGSIVLNHRTPTNVENVNANVNVNKILRNGQLIIIRDGKQYNAQGIQL